MMPALQEFRSLPTSSSQVASDTDRFVASQGAFFPEDHVLSDFGLQPARNLVLVANASGTLLQRGAQATASREHLFNSLVALKVAISQYAMHLSSQERHRLFEELDSKINEDDWHEEDLLPRTNSFIDFLKWMIHAKYFKWTSIGVSAAGTILVAWKTTNVMLTANFEKPGSVRWTAQVKSANGEVGQSAGISTLRLFADQALFYLRQISDAQADQHHQP
jgi:hypothetical protein